MSRQKGCVVLPHRAGPLLMEKMGAGYFVRKRQGSLKPGRAFR